MGPSCLRRPCYESTVPEENHQVPVLVETKAGTGTGTGWALNHASSFFQHSQNCSELLVHYWQQKKKQLAVSLTVKQLQFIYQHCYGRPNNL